MKPEPELEIPMTCEQRVEEALVRLKHLMHLIEGMDRKHPFFSLALDLASDTHQILEEGYLP